MNPHLSYNRTQQTIASTVTVAGFGFWSGVDVTLEFRPAPAETGLVFLRTEKDQEVPIPADVQYRQEVPRRTNLHANGTHVDMVEHVVAALTGLEIDNCFIWASTSEMPGVDGSSMPFVNALLNAGVVNQDNMRQAITIDSTIRVAENDAWIEARPPKTPGTMSLSYQLDYGSNVPIGPQRFSIDVCPSSFQNELAPARTFVLQSEADQLQASGRGLRVTTADLLVFDENGPVNNSLRFEDECVRHKTLDLVGDLALAGTDLHGDFEAHRTGHRLNAELVRQILFRHNFSSTLADCA
ncbi:MAG: UDP-3-O-[3-hydroxymyristoyl] N-acetylglucosamine deacetylase [Planctomycetaceae bacterium]|jgi:UDP-3-O-[3-hydroxymyristoyl] N-acetylglucosamine deacetylase|nr:UDP-3-O-[3-hydroxymyristoyl] N-acetylglucosamine deacetylase [Planctomycetaceae bacterium]MBT4724505.1 UDP-3-O-[3-hydroxymyristoyl] N-acetylglucosamine deacetylase [Planctomycetaceae bacterium]MBT4844212.1 UDP-3-O-[3-hydroxymyristoyl] N-acetylglucosamine deacetylase [Planctomycetaceae bacterium]MBT5125812.1 UDP-3-O-[3-hydroxymyristoyl] N-acetylglucosamine deacetylase [Planctomycetaceae bacterium]MBT5598363.1 UDP-3-O-[3-hydroxymyristoyl] N-acetylglucosamine deacetylase [Planctomycetaceae bact